jgi:hypothetical protein
MIALLLVGTALAAEPLLALDRVDVLAADPGTWLNLDLPMLGATPALGALRFVAQVQPVWRTPREGLFIGTSVASQSVVYEVDLRDFTLAAPNGTFAYGGVQTALLLPRGLVLGGGLRVGPLRAAAGLSVLSAATWRRPDYGHWNVYPVIALGFGPPK